MDNPGYTTGSSAAAACKIAVKTLFTGVKSDFIEIDTPKGTRLKIKAHYNSIGQNEVNSYVFKNRSEDPDVTKGVKVCAKAIIYSDPGIYIKSGEGIGVVTKGGLSVPIGKPAINPVPMSMIIKEIEKVLPEDAGVEVTLSVPEGLELSKRTFNSKLGIIGGISILGTTGLVEPMSQDAFRESLKLEMSVCITSGDKSALSFIFGNFGKNYLLDNNVNDRVIIKTSNFIGFMIKTAAEMGIKKILLAGHAGKMVKVAYNMENTHSEFGDNRMESIVESCKDLPNDLKENVLKSNTTDEAIEVLKGNNKDQQVFEDIADRCKKNCESWVNNMVKVECIIFTNIYGTIASTPDAEKLLGELKTW